MVLATLLLEGRTPLGLAKMAEIINLLGRHGGTK
jgi:hypothetical protein